MATILLIDQAYLISNSVIDDNVDYSKVRPMIEDIQTDIIMPILTGTDLYNQIITQIQSSPVAPFSGLSTDNKYLLDTYIKKIIALYVAKELCVTLKFRMMNAGVQVRTTENSQSAETADIWKLADYWKNKAESKGQLMLDYIRANPTKYPAFYTAVNLNSKMPATSTYDVDIFLEDTTYRDRPNNGLPNNYG